MIRNDTKNVVLSTNVKFIRGLFAQAFGLMFRKPLDDCGWVFLLPRVSKWHVTNLFVFFDITVLWLDENKRVLQVASLSSFQYKQAGIPGTKYLIELPANASLKVSKGDLISF